MAEANEAEKQHLITLEQQKYSTKEMKQAVKDLAEGKITDEQFSEIFSEAINSKMEKRFGNISLSMKEIKDYAKSITFGAFAGQVDKFAQAANQAQNSFANFKNAALTVNRWTWKASLGLKL